MAEESQEIKKGFDRFLEKFSSDNAEKRAADKISLEAEMQKLTELKSSIEAQGGVAANNAEYNKQDLAVKLKDLDLQKRSATNKGAQEEIEKERQAAIAKQGSVLQKISAGIMGIGTSMKEKALAGGKSLMSILKGTLFAGLFFAIAEFFNSPLFPKLVDLFTNTILPKIQNLFNDFMNFVKDPSFENLGKLIGDNKLALVGLAAILAPGKFLKVLKLGFLALKGATVFLGKDMMKDAKGVRFGKTKGMFSKVFGFVKGKVGLLTPIITAIGAKFGAIGAAITAFTGVALAPLALIVAGFVAVGYALYNSFKAFTKRFEETGSIGESIKAGISTFLGTLIALPATLLQKIVSFFAGLFGFDSFKEKLDSFDFIGDTSKAIEKIIDYVIGFFTGLPEKISAFFKKYIGPDAQWAKDIQKSITDFFAPIINFDFSALLGDLLAKAGKIGKKIASFFGFGGGEKGEEGAKAKAETKASTADVIVQFEKERQTLQNRIEQLEARAARGFRSSSARRSTEGELSFRERQLKALDKSAIAKSLGGDAASVNVVAPQAKVTNNNANTSVSNTQYVGNPDPLLRMAAGVF